MRTAMTITKPAKARRSDAGSRQEPSLEHRFVALRHPKGLDRIEGRAARRDRAARDHDALLGERHRARAGARREEP